MKLITASPATSARRSWRRSLASVLVVGLGASAGFGLGVGCRREPQPTIFEPAPSDEPPPPLPPASGTPIGFLVDDARLKLSDDQLIKLRDIDADLANKLADLDAIQRGTETADQSGPPQPSGRGNSTLGVTGERTGDGTTGGSSQTTAPHGGRIKNPERVPGPDAAPASKEDLDRTRKRLPEVRAYDVREAIKQALALLDRDQQKLAREVLKDRGVDPDTGRFDAVGTPGVTRGSDDGSGSASGSSHFGRRDR